MKRILGTRAMFLVLSVWIAAALARQLHIDGVGVGVNVMCSLSVGVGAYAMLRWANGPR